MTFSHRDHRFQRDLTRVSVGLAVAAAPLIAGVELLPSAGLRLLALVGLGAAGAAYIGAAESLIGAYHRDLTAVKAGTESSGLVRAEVYHEIGLERGRRDAWGPSPQHRRPSVPESGARARPTDPSDPTSGPAPPSAGS